MRPSRPPSGIGWYTFSLFGFSSRMICLYPPVHSNPSILALIVRKKWASVMSWDDLMHAGCMDSRASDSELRYILAAKQKLVSYRINKKHNQTWAPVRVQPRCFEPGLCDHPGPWSKPQTITPYVYEREKAWNLDHRLAIHAACMAQWSHLLANKSNRFKSHIISERLLVNRQTRNVWTPDRE
jgi:hypothetical protein